MCSSKSYLFESCEHFTCEEESSNLVAYIHIKRKLRCGWIGFFDDVEVKEIFERNWSNEKRKSFK